MSRFFESLRYASVLLYMVFLFGVLFKGDSLESVHFTLTPQLFWGITFQFFYFYCKIYPQNASHILYLIQYFGAVTVALRNIAEYPNEFHYGEP